MKKYFINKFFKNLSKNNHGIGLPATIITVFLLAAVGISITYLIIYNQQIRGQQVTREQAFYSVQAGLEFAIAKVVNESSTNASFSPKFDSETVNITRSSNRINVAAPNRGAYAEHSIDDPNPPASLGCLVVDISGANIFSNSRLQGITLSRDPSCTGVIAINSLSGTTWQPDNGQQMTQVLIEGAPHEYNGPPENSGGSFVFGTAFTINDSIIHTLDRINWNADVTYTNFTLIFNYTYDGTPYIKTVQVDFLGNNQASCFSWDTSNARLNYTGGAWSQLTGTSVTNSCPDPIRLDKMTIGWNPTTPTRHFVDLNIGSSNIYSGSASSGDEIDVDDVYTATSTETVDWFEFDDEMLEGGKSYSVTWTFADGTEDLYSLNLFADPQNTCLNIDTSSAGIGMPDTQITGLKIENTCGADVGIISITLSWAGDASRRFTEAIIYDVDGSNTYIGSVQSGTALDFGSNDLYLINGGGIKNVEKIQFNNNIIHGSQYTIAFNMSDGTVASATIKLAAAVQANSLSVNTSGAYYSNSNTRLNGITISNTGASAISWNYSIISWTPLSPSRTMSRIRVSNNNIYNNPAVSSGVQVNNSDVSLSSGQTRPIDYILFNSSMSGRSYTIQFVMADSSIKIIGPFTP